MVEAHTSPTSAAKQQPVAKCLNLNRLFQQPAPPRHGSWWTTCQGQNGRQCHKTFTFACYLESNVKQCQQQYFSFFRMRLHATWKKKRKKEKVPTNLYFPECLAAGGRCGRLAACCSQEHILLLSVVVTREELFLLCMEQPNNISLPLQMDFRRADRCHISDKKVKAMYQPL